MFFRHFTNTSKIATTQLTQNTLKQHSENYTVKNAGATSNTL